MATDAKNRWWVYLDERFPLVKNGLLIAVFAAAAVGYAAVLARETPPPQLVSLPGAMLIAFLTLFLFFFQLRVADEFKDYADDAQFRSYRPVPRGLVSLHELGVLAIAAAVIQFGLAFSLGWGMVLLLALVWGYIWLMREEFFAPDWLKAHPVLYMLSHMVVMPLMALYASACFWLPAGLGLPATLGWFLLVSYCNGMVIELGRKIRAPQDEETGVETYSALWGRSNAVTVWLAVMGSLAIASLLAAHTIQFLPLVVLILLLLLTAAMIVSWRFLSNPITRWAKSFEWISGLSTLLVYTSLGILPLFLQHRL
ncbi:MAG: UbiA family prenyltransferase [Cyanobacteria bacterium J06638_20]